MSPAPTCSHQEQEDRILDAAATCIENSSLLDFTMSAISKESGFSMGSIYKHIQTKEDVLVALAYRVYCNLFDVFSAIDSLPLTTPQRLVAAKLFCKEKVCLYEFDGHLENLVNSKAVLQRASAHWLEKMIRMDKSIEDLFTTIIRNGCNSGELIVELECQESLVEEINVGLWSLCVGFNQVVVQLDARNAIGEGTDLSLMVGPGSPIIKNVQRLVNSYPWKEPVTDFDIQMICDVLEARGLR